MSRSLGPRRIHSVRSGRTLTPTARWPKCGVCGRPIPVDDRARIGDEWFCHPYRSSVTSCYEKASWR